MLPTDFAQMLKRATVELDVSSILEWVNPLLESSQDRAIDDAFRQKAANDLFSARDAYHRLVQQPEFAAILDDIGLGEYLTPVRITELLNILQKHGSYMNLRTSLHDCTAYRALQYRLRTLQLLSTAAQRFLFVERLAAVEASHTVQFVLLDFAGAGIELDRAQEGLHELDDLVRAVDEVYEGDGLIPRIALIESGSNIELYVVVSAAVAAALSPLFKQALDYFLHGNAEDFDRALRSTDKALEVLAKVHSRERDGSLSSEEARRLRHRIIDNLKRLFRRGILTRDTLRIEREAVDQGRLLGD